MNARQRLDAIERRVGSQQDACPHCGSEIHGVYISVATDGTQTPRCLGCCGERDWPDHPCKGYAAGLIEAL